MDTTIRESKLSERLTNAIKQTAPGTALRHALDMIIAGHLGALICIGDTESVLAAGDDGFKLDISFTANRLFELSKMDGAIVIDKEPSHGGSHEPAYARNGHLGVGAPAGHHALR